MERDTLVPKYFVRSRGMVVWLSAVFALTLISCRVRAQGAPELSWFTNPPWAISSAIYSLDGKLLAIGGYAGIGVVELRDASTFKLVRSLDTAADDAGSVAFSPDGKTLAVGGFYSDIYAYNYGVAELWSVSTGKRLSSLPVVADEVYSVAFSPDGKTLALGGNYSAGFTDYVSVLELWSVSTGKRLSSLATAANYVFSVAFSPDGKTLAVGGYYVPSSGVNYYGVAELWSVSTGKLLSSLATAANSGVNSVAFSPNGKTLAVGGNYSDGNTTYIGVAELWSVSTSQRLSALATAANYGVGSVVFSPDGKTLAVGGDYSDGNVNNYGVAELWSVSAGTRLASLATAAEYVGSVAFSPDGTTLALGGSYSDRLNILHSILELWSVSTDQRLSSLSSTGVGVNSVALSPDGKTLAVGGYQGGSFIYSPYYSVVLDLWSMSTGQWLASPPTAANYVDSVALSPDGKTLAIGGGYTTGVNHNGYGVAELWSVSTGQRLATLATAANLGVNSVSFSPNGKILAVGGYNNSEGVAELWSVRTGLRLASRATAASSVISVAFSPDGKTLAVGGAYRDSSGNYHGVAELWSVQTNLRLASLATAANVVNSVAFSPDGKNLALGGNYTGGSATPPGVAELWSVNNGTRLASLVTPPTAPAPVENYSVAFSPDGKTLAVGAFYYNINNNPQGLLQLWRVSTGQLLRYYDRFTGRVTTLTFAPGGDLLAYGCEGGLVAVAYTSPPLSSLLLSPNPVKGGSVVTGTVTLAQPAIIDTVVKLTNTNPRATLSVSSVTVTAGATSATFTLTTSTTAANVSGMVRATLGSVSKSVSLTVTP